MENPNLKFGWWLGVSRYPPILGHLHIFPSSIIINQKPPGFEKQMRPPTTHNSNDVFHAAFQRNMGPCGARAVRRTTTGDRLSRGYQRDINGDAWTCLHLWKPLPLGNHSPAGHPRSQVMQVRSWWENPEGSIWSSLSNLVNPTIDTWKISTKVTW